MRRPASALILALALAIGCGGGSTEPTGHVPALGAYQHSATDQGVTYHGTLTLTYATADSIAGSWNVPGYASAPRLGGKNMAGGYAIKADRTDGGYPITFTLVPTGSAFTCSGRILVITGGSTVDRAVPCSMTR